MVKDAMLIDSLLTVKTIGYHHTVGAHVDEMAC